MTRKNYFKKSCLEIKIDKMFGLGLVFSTWNPIISLVVTCLEISFLRKKELEIEGLSKVIEFKKFFVQIQAFQNFGMGFNISRSYIVILIGCFDIWFVLHRN